MPAVDHSGGASVCFTCEYEMDESALLGRSDWGCPQLVRPLPTGWNQGKGANGANTIPGVWFLPSAGPHMVFIGPSGIVEVLTSYANLLVCNSYPAPVTH